MRLSKHVLGNRFEGHEAEIPCFDPGTQLICVRTAKLNLPHQFFPTLKTNYPIMFYKIMGTPAEWDQFWSMVQDGSWFWFHPHADYIRQFPERSCPYVLYGNDSGVNKKQARGMRLLSFYSPLSFIQAAGTKNPICTNPTPTHSKLTKDMERCMNTQVVWSGNALTLNEHPAADAVGNTFENKKLRKVASTPIF